MEFCYVVKLQNGDSKMEILLKLIVFQIIFIILLFLRETSFLRHIVEEIYTNPVTKNYYITSVIFYT